jgi:hypothetical protein
VCNSVESTPPEKAVARPSAERPAPGVAVAPGPAPPPDSDAASASSTASTAADGGRRVAGATGSEHGAAWGRAGTETGSPSAGDHSNHAPRTGARTRSR